MVVVSWVWGVAGLYRAGRRDGEAWPTWKWGSRVSGPDVPCWAMGTRARPSVRNGPAGQGFQGTAHRLAVDFRSVHSLGKCEIGYCS